MTHPLFSEELFVPITVLGDVTSLDEAIDLANSTEYGLTAGVEASVLQMAVLLMSLSK